MRRTIMVVATVLLTAGVTVFSAAPALAPGYVSSPPSRQAM